MTPRLRAAARALLLVEGVALLWVGLGVLVFALFLGGVIAGFGGGQGAYLELTGAGILPLACGLAILATRRRLPARMPSAIGVLAQVALLAPAALDPPVGRWLSIASVAAAALGLLATALLATEKAG